MLTREKKNTYERTEEEIQESKTRSDIVPSQALNKWL